MECDIFISYRRSDGTDIARSVEQALKARGYQNIFYDYTSLRDGVFNEKIIDAINNCNDYILLLTPEALDRCAEEGNWVAREIETAILAGCQFIPLAVNENYTIFPKDFPKKLRIIQNIQQTILLNNEYFEDSITHLSERLTSVPKKLAPSEDCQLTIHTDETSQLFIDDVLQSKIKGGKQTVIKQLKEGQTYQVKLVNLGRKGVELTRDWVATESGTLNMSFSEEREKVEKQKQEERQKKDSEREGKRLKEAALKLALAEYDSYNEYRAANTDYIVCKGNKLGYVSDIGHELLPCIYDEVTEFVDGIACVKQNGIYNIIDRNGNVVVNNYSDQLTIPNKGHIVTMRSGKEGLIDYSGREVLPCIYDSIRLTVSPDHFIVLEGGNWHLYSISQKRTLGRGFQDFNKDHHNESEDSGNLYFPDDTYWACYCFPIIIYSNGRYGLLDIKGNDLVPCSAQSINPVRAKVINLEPQPFAIIKQNNKFGLVSMDTGNYIIPLIYDFMCIDEMEDKMVLIVGLGGILEKKEYSTHGYVLNGGKIGALDLDGKELVPPIYDEVWSMWDDYDENGKVHPFLSCRDNKNRCFDHYSSNGKWIRRREWR